MKPGSRLDAFVADHVMGWTQKPGSNRHDLPSYSTDIAAAWTIIEKLKSMGLEINLNTQRVERYEPIEVEWYCDIWDRRGENKHLGFSEGISSARSPSAAVAICLAALKAVGFETTSR